MATLTKTHKTGGWTAFPIHVWQPIGDAPRIQTWIGRATCHALASRVLGDLCFRLAANGIRDETQGMIAKVYSTKALLQTAINVYQIQGGRSVHSDERRALMRSGGQTATKATDALIENYIGENMHEFTIATVYEGPNPVLADVGAPNAMTRSIRAKYLEPIGMAEVQGSFGLAAKARFWHVHRRCRDRLFLIHWSARWTESKTSSLKSAASFKKRCVRNRILGRRILLIIAKYQKTFMDQCFLMGDEGGIFDQLCFSLASLVYALSLDEYNAETLFVARFWTSKPTWH